MGDVVMETTRTRLRLWTPADADRILDLYSRWEVAKWLGADPKVMQTREQAEATAERWGERSAGDDAFGFWAVERKSDGVVAGTQLLVPLQGGEDDEVEIGWHFHPDSWGQGLASESARAVLHHGWSYGLPEIHAVVRAGNEPSIAVCTRIGMTQLGLTTQYYDTELEHFRIARPGLPSNDPTPTGS